MERPVTTRLVPSSPGSRGHWRAVETRNGMPAPRRYVYRGTGEDTDPETSTWTDRKRDEAA